MGRPQEFDTAVAVDAVLQAFWELGPQRVTIDDLTAASGLSRSSLYNAFGGKQSLFELALQRYVERQAACLQTLLATPLLRSALEQLFQLAVTDNYRGRGCLLVNCAAGLMAGESREQELLRRGFERMRGLVEQRLRRGQECGELAPAVCPAQAATLICASLSGFRILRKAGMPAAQLEQSAQLAIDNLLRQPG